MVLKIVLPVLGLFVVCFACAQISCPPNLDFEQGNFNHWTCYTGSAYSQNGINKIQVSPGAPIYNRHEIMSSSPAQTPVDPYGGFPVVCPYGSGHSIKLGNDNTGGEAEKVSYSISIPANQPDYSITYYYAVVF